MRRTVLSALMICCASCWLIAQEPPTPDTPQPPAAGGATPPRPGGLGANQDPQPYDQVITKEAKSKKGIFTVHTVKDKYYYEIPAEHADRQDDDRRWLRRPAVVEPGGLSGEERQQDQPADGELRSGGRSEDASRAGGEGGEQQSDHDEFSGCGVWHR